MKCGISTSCLYPMETKESLQTLTDMGFQEFEVFFLIHFVKYNLLTHWRCENAWMITVLLCVRYIPFTSGFESALIFYKLSYAFFGWFEFYKQYFEAANILGASILVLHGQNNCGRYGGIEEKGLFRKISGVV